MIQKASQDWEEYDKVLMTKKQSSTTETSKDEPRTAEEIEDRNYQEIRIVIAQEYNSNQLGIGVEVTSHNQAKAEWALVERKLSSVVQDEAQAIGIVLSKALEHNWSKVKVKIKNKQLRTLLQIGRFKDVCMVVLIGSFTRYNY